MHYEEAKDQFIASWGSFGSSWGINKAMAQIHALLLISPKPLSTDDIMAELQISRGNANMNIRSLMDWGLCHKQLIKGERKEFFYTGKDIYKLAKQVSAERRKRELVPLLELMTNVKQMENDKSAETEEFLKITGDIDSFLGKADKVMRKFEDTESRWFFETLMKFIR